MKQLFSVSLKQGWYYLVLYGEMKFELKVASWLD